MPELISHLKAIRADLCNRMANELAAEGDWHAWLPLLARIETAIQAVAAVEAGDGV